MQPDLRGERLHHDLMPTPRCPCRPLPFGRCLHKLSSGDILVCSYTNPAWTPLFQRAVAVVVDSGAIGSHAAIVAREYGIPAIMGTGVGTTVLKDGQLVSVDGDRGQVSGAAPQTTKHQVREHLWPDPDSSYPRTGQLGLSMRRPTAALGCPVFFGVGPGALVGLGPSSLSGQELPARKHDPHHWALYVLIESMGAIFSL